MIRLKDLCIIESKEELASIPQGKKLINTINAHSLNTAKKDKLFAEALMNGDYHCHVGTIGPMFDFFTGGHISVSLMLKGSLFGVIVNRFVKNVA